MLSLFSSRFCIVCLLASYSFAAGSPANDSSETVYHSGVSEVRITFFATDGNNRPVEKISVEDFAVVDSGVVVRNFRSLTKSDETTLDVVALVDVSESVAARFRSTVDDLLQLISQKQLAADDHLSVISFGGPQPALLCSRDCRSSAAQKLAAIKPAGATPLFDALVAGIDLINQHKAPGVRPVLVLFSDGDDTISRHTSGDALNAMISSGVVLYAIDLNNPRDAQSSIFLERLADTTGGRYFSIRDGSVHVLEAALEDLRASYVVTYPLPTTTIGLHSLRILPKHDLTLRFHSRTSYDCEASAQ
jgi:VWFA-related protein